MNWAILSDVHGNLEALQAVLEDASGEGAEEIAFLGDGVGYGANPNECLRVLRERTERWVAGNHDYGAVGRTAIADFNPEAQAALVWTGQELFSEGREFLRELPLWRQEKDFWLVHSSPHQPGEWPYIFGMQEAQSAFHALPARLAFVGHSHFPVIFAESATGEVKGLPAQKLTLEKDVRYIINVGSVGQPRDRDPRAAYGFFDDTGPAYALKRVEYDISAAQKKIIQAGFPVNLAERLSRGA
jgi:diadenosine tetraphosphatase ApaH/serine/threonine PP2A family protein phosphatase